MHCTKSTVNMFTSVKCTDRELGEGRNQNQKTFHTAYSLIKPIFKAIFDLTAYKMNFKNQTTFSKANQKCILRIPYRVYESLNNQSCSTNITGATKVFKKVIPIEIFG